MSKPTKKERDIALKVLEFYEPLAANVSAVTEQERPYEWARGCEVWIELLKSDPEDVFNDYLEEYKAGR